LKNNHATVRSEGPTPSDLVKQEVNMVKVYIVSYTPYDITFQIGNIRYTYRVSETHIQTALRIAKYSNLKALNYIKKRSAEFIKERR